jgi:hypothetical protein
MSQRLDGSCEQNSDEVSVECVALKVKWVERHVGFAAQESTAADV